MDRDTLVDYLSALTDQEFAALTADRTSRRREVPEDVRTLVMRELNPEEG